MALRELFTDIADAIREKKGTSELINPQDFHDEIIDIETGGKIPEYMSAKSFTFDGETCTGYTGDPNAPLIIIPKHYSIEEIKIERGASAKLNPEVFDKLNENKDNSDYRYTLRYYGLYDSAFPVTLSNKDCTKVLEINSDTTNEDVVTTFDRDNIYIKCVDAVASYTYWYHMSWTRNVKYPIICNGVTYKNQSAFSVYLNSISSSGIGEIRHLDFVGDTEVPIYGDGDDIKVTTINGLSDPYTQKGFLTVNGTLILQNNITSLPDSCFRDTNVKHIILPDTLTQLPESLFMDCKNLETANIPYGVTKLSSYIFSRCSNLQSITIPDSIKGEAGYRVFGGCSNLKTIYLPDDISILKQGIFEACDSLEYVHLPDNLTDLASNCFDNCTSLKNITLPNSLKIMRTRAFTKCKSLQKIDLPEGLTTIEFLPFEDCESLTKLHIPASVTNIDGNIAATCYGIKELTVDSNNSKYKSIDNYVIDKNTNALVMICAGTDLDNLSTKITELGKLIFWKEPRLIDYTVPNSIKIIRESAFGYCQNLTTLTMSNNVTTIEDGIFTNCTNLQTIILSEHITNLG